MPQSTPRSVIRRISCWKVPMMAAPIGQPLFPMSRWLCPWNAIFPQRSRSMSNQVLQEVDFANSTPYTTYRVTINNVRDDANANSMQIAEVQFLGVQQPVAPGIVVQPSPASTPLLKGGTYATTSLQASGPFPYFYQWFSVLAGVTNGIANATNASLTLNNVQLSQSGNYFCVVSNLYGATASSLLSLTVVLPSPGYVSTIAADGPIAYWRLDEG